MTGDIEFPGVYLDEIAESGRVINGVETAVTAFIGRTVTGDVCSPVAISSFAEFENLFGGLDADLPLTYAVRDFFQNGGVNALIVRLTKIGGKASEGLDVPTYIGNEDEKTGIYALLRADAFNLLCIPPDTRGGDVPPVVYQAALAFCVQHKAFLIVDSPAAWTGKADAAVEQALAGFEALGLTGPDGRNGAIYFPRVNEFDPLRNGEIGTFAPCGIIAGIMARTDANEGVWKAPAGTDAAINGVAGLDVVLNDDQNESLNANGINCLRTFPAIGTLIWGARTLRGSDQISDEYKYIPVRRLALYIENSLNKGLQWAVFEPNNAVLWSAIRVDVTNFMMGLFRQSAFMGGAANEAFFVRCDATTTSQEDIDQGIVNVMIGFAPVMPAEFVIIYLQQMAGQTA